ncbi:MAG: ester cyclase [Anaerolineales bacterium]
MNQQPKDKLDEQSIRDFFAKWETALNSGDPERVASLMTDDVVYSAPEIPETLHGRDAVSKYLGVFFRAFPEQKYELLEMYRSLDGTWAADRVRWQGTMFGPLDPPGFAPTGTRVEAELAGFFQFRDGLISSFTAIYDMLHIGQQIGAAPGAGSLGERMGVLMQRLAARRMRRRDR